MKGGKLMKKKQKKKLAKLIIKAITAIALLISAIAQLIQALNLYKPLTNKALLVKTTEERERNLPILCNNSITHISLKEK